MPYYKIINTLFIHIPKTGGTSLENYLKSKCRQTLYCGVPRNNLLPVRNVSLQHQFYSTLYENRVKADINFDDSLKIISIVRNPYNRLVSDLFHFNLIKKNSSHQQVFAVIQRYIHGTNYDNHNVPQYKFICNEDGTLMNPKIKVFRTETLTRELLQYGFKGFSNKHLNNGRSSNKNYMSYLNKESIGLINSHYSKDFEIFNYKKH